MDFLKCDLCGGPVLFTIKDKKISHVNVCKCCRGKQTGSFKIIKEPPSERKLYFQEIVCPWLQSLVGDLSSFMDSISHKEDVHPEFSIRTRNRWLVKIQKEIFGNHFDRKGYGLLSIFAFQLQKRGVLHQHGLVSGEALREYNLKSKEGLLNHTMKGLGRIKRVDDLSGAIGYCFEETFVHGNNELDVWGPSRSTATPDTIHGDRQYQKYYESFIKPQKTR